MTTFRNFGPVNKWADAEWMNEMRAMEEDHAQTLPAPCLALLASLAHAELDAAAAAIYPLAGTKGPCPAAIEDQDSEAQRSVGEVRGQTVLTYSGPDWLSRKQAG